jgi:cobalt-zinc-cadmium resistance protein CzcA
MAGLPNVEGVRSLSKFGLSQVTVVFNDGVNIIYFARQLVQERLEQAREQIPAELGRPEMGPVSTGLGEIFQYTVEAPHGDLTELRTIQDWIVKPMLRTVPDADAIGRLLVRAPGGERVPLASLARIEELEGPAEITHENASRLIIVEGNVRGRDIAGFVADVRRLFEHKSLSCRQGIESSSGDNSRTSNVPATVCSWSSRSASF